MVQPQGGSIALHSSDVKGETKQLPQQHGPGSLKAQTETTKGKAGFGYSVDLGKQTENSFLIV